MDATKITRSPIYIDVANPRLATRPGPSEAFQCSTEFAHVHPAGDGSLHTTDDVVETPSDREEKAS